MFRCKVEDKIFTHFSYSLQNCIHICAHNMCVSVCVSSILLFLPFHYYYILFSLFIFSTQQHYSHLNMLMLKGMPKINNIEYFRKIFKSSVGVHTIPILCSIYSICMYVYRRFVFFCFFVLLLFCLHLQFCCYAHLHFQ